jgi:hypothetical protein
VIKRNEFSDEKIQRVNKEPKTPLTEELADKNS